MHYHSQANSQGWYVPKNKEKESTSPVSLLGGVPTPSVGARSIPMKEGISLHPILDHRVLNTYESISSEYWHTACFVDDKDADRVLNHLSTLGFRINMKKCQLEASQHREFQGLSINSLFYWVMLSEGRIMSFTQCLTQFQMERVVS